jgi:hypothetical protein
MHSKWKIPGNRYLAWIYWLIGLYYTPFSVAAWHCFPRFISQSWMRWSSKWWILRGNGGFVSQVWGFTLLGRRVIKRVKDGFGRWRTNEGGCFGGKGVIWRIQAEDIGHRRVNIGNSIAINGWIRLWGVEIMIRGFYSLIDLSMTWALQYFSYWDPLGTGLGIQEHGYPIERSCSRPQAGSQLLRGREQPTGKLRGINIAWSLPPPPFIPASFRNCHKAYSPEGHSKRTNES